MTPPATSQAPETTDAAILRLVETLQRTVDKLDQRVTSHETKCDGREERAQEMRHKLRDDVQAMFGETNAGIARLSEKVDTRVEALHARISAQKDGTAAAVEAVGQRVISNREAAMRYALVGAAVIISAMGVLIGWAVPLALQVMAAAPLTGPSFGVMP